MMFTNLLDQELERRGYRTIHQKAAACDVTYEAMRQILKDGKHLSDEKVVEIGRKLGLSDEKMAEMIMAKVYDKTKTPEQKNIISAAIKSMRVKPIDQIDGEPALIPQEKYTIPIYSSIMAGNAEMGIIDGQPTGDIVSVDGEYKKMGAFAMKISGDSMTDDLYDGEIAIFKPIDGESLRDKDIFAVEIEGWSSWVVKYVKKDPSGIVQLISANPAYPVREIDPKITRITLRGRLIESRRIRR